MRPHALLSLSPQASSAALKLGSWAVPQHSRQPLRAAARALSGSSVAKVAGGGGRIQRHVAHLPRPQDTFPDAVDNSQTPWSPAKFPHLAATLAAAAAAASAAGFPGHQPQQLRLRTRQAAASARLGSKQGAEGVLGGDGHDAGGGVDAGRWGRAAAAGLPPPYLQHAAVGSQRHSGGGGAGVQRLSRDGSCVSSGSAATSSAGSQGGARRVLMSRKQQMLRAIHKRAMQLFLRAKQRNAKLASARQQHRRQQEG